MPYREIPQLDPHIACVWIRDPEPLAQRHRILPDACVDIVWAGSRLVVAGPATGPTFATIPANTTAMGIRFRVGAAGAALGLPAAEVLDANVPLEDVWRDGREISERIGERPDPDALAAIVRAQIVAEPDALVRAAATGLEPNLGARQLRRRFADAVGYGPKTLQRILRFQRFLALAQTSTDLARLALEAGYADQAHLTRECSRLAGLPPAALLAAGAGPAGDRSASFKTAGPVAATLAA
ncbi:MAG TPA: helix-turn-helix domain-containing protein [Solirubrobacteraceae bacterium]|nr:helix-turn-helix domain-containing protein [Solirubrobacteraceae bacterium]